MSPPQDPIKHKAVARIFIADTLKGTGVLVSPKHILTCSHVIDGHHDNINVDFPAQNLSQLPTRVCTYYPYKKSFGVGDIADICILELEGALSSERVATLLHIDSYYKRTVQLYGFHNMQGYSIEAKIGSSNVATGYPQIEISREGKVQQGFSGGAVWDEETGYVVGIVPFVRFVGQEQTQTVVSLASMIPVPKLLQAWQGFQTQSIRRDIPLSLQKLPDSYVHRSREEETLAEMLLNQDSQQTIAITSLVGAGGFGKSTLALKLCYELKDHPAFKDGILSVTLGEQPKSEAELINLIDSWLRHFDKGASNTLDEAQRQLREVLADRSCLLLVDDVWHGKDLKPFLQQGKRCKVLVTTRDASQLPNTASLAVDAMASEESLELLLSNICHSQDLDPEGKDAALSLVKQLGNWPLLLKLVNRHIFERHQQRHDLLSAIKHTHKRLQRKGLQAFRDSSQLERHQAAKIVLESSLELLDTAADATPEHFYSLAIFPDDTAIPLSQLALCWRCDEDEAEDICLELEQRSFFQSYSTEYVYLHDVMRQLIRERLGGEDIAKAQDNYLQALLPNSKQWQDLAPKNSYAWQQLAHHLIEARRTEELSALLLDPDFQENKLHYLNLQSLLEDYALLIQHLQSTRDNDHG